VVGLLSLCELLRPPLLELLLLELLLLLLLLAAGGTAAGEVWGLGKANCDLLLPLLLSPPPEPPPPPPPPPPAVRGPLLLRGRSKLFLYLRVLLSTEAAGESLSCGVKRIIPPAWVQWWGRSISAHSLI
jgi:hypothetical protein